MVTAARPKATFIFGFFAVLHHLRDSHIDMKPGEEVNSTSSS